MRLWPRSGKRTEIQVHTDDPQAPDPMRGVIIQGLLLHQYDTDGGLHYIEPVSERPEERTAEFHRLFGEGGYVTFDDGQQPQSKDKS